MVVVRAFGAPVQVLAVAIALLLLGLHLVEPEFDPTWRFVSEYALGLVILALAACGFLLAAAFQTDPITTAGHSAAPMVGDRYAVP